MSKVTIDVVDFYLICQEGYGGFSVEINVVAIGPHTPVTLPPQGAHPKIKSYKTACKISKSHGFSTKIPNIVYGSMRCVLIAKSMQIFLRWYEEISSGLIGNAKLVQIPSKITVLLCRPDPLC